MSDLVRAARRMTLDWRVRPSLLSYLQRMPDFAVTATGGAEFTGDAVRLPAVENADGTLRATGAIDLSGHGGALRLPLHGVVLTPEALWIDDPLEEGATRRLVLVRPGGSDGEGGTAGTSALETRLAAESDILFLYSYLPDAPFGELFVREV